MAKRSGKLHLNAFLMPAGHHEASWRLPDSDPNAHLEVDYYANLARIAERGKLCGAPTIVCFRLSTRAGSSKCKAR